MYVCMQWPGNDIHRWNNLQLVWTASLTTQPTIPLPYIQLVFGQNKPVPYQSKTGVDKVYKNEILINTFLRFVISFKTMKKLNR